MEDIVIPFLILMSIYEKEKPEYLRQSFESIEDNPMAHQSLYWFADGILPDKLYGEINEFKQKLKIKIIKLDKNYGLGYALRERLCHCENEIVDRVDICHMNRFEFQIEEFETKAELSVLVGIYLSLLTS